MNYIRQGNVPLEMPAIATRDNYAPGQRAMGGGMYYCKGRLGERQYQLGGKNGWFKWTNHLVGKRLHRQLTQARAELLRIQEIYKTLGLDPNLNNANKEIQISWEWDTRDPLRTLELEIYTYRTDESSLKGRSIKGVCRLYRIALEKKYPQELRVA